MYEKRSHIRFTIDERVIIRTEGDAANIFKGELVEVGFLGFSAYLKDKIEVNTIVRDVVRVRE